MNFELLKDRPAGPHVGGLNAVYFALASEIYSMPDMASESNKGAMSNNIVFKTGKGWKLLYTTFETIKLNEKSSDKRNNDAYTTTLTAKRPGFEENFHQFAAEYGSEDFFLLVYKNGKQYPILVGRKSCPAHMTVELDSAEAATDDNNYALTFVSTGAYASPFYKGSITASESIIAADDATPNVASGTTFITSANTVATAITDLDNPVVGSQVTLIGGSDTNSSTIANAGNFSLSAAMTLSLGSFIRLYVRADNDYVELARG